MDWFNNLNSGGRKAVYGCAAVLLFILASVVTSCVADAAEPTDDGVWSSDQTALQGFVVQYAPVLPPAVVFYWFTYDEAGEQAWFISENVPVHSGRSEDLVDVFKPVCAFVADDACALGDPVGALAIGRRGEQISVRFGISTALPGFSEDCAAGITIAPRPSPAPPPIPDKYGCQSELLLSRITPEIIELSR